MGPVDLLEPPSIPLPMDTGISVSSSAFSELRHRPHSPSPPSSPGGYGNYGKANSVSRANSLLDRKPRSRWSQVVAGVSGSIGSLVVNDEMIRGLKYCLQWLQVQKSKKVLKF